jgi:HEAT repeat protein
VPAVRAAAIRAIGAIGNEDAVALARPMTVDRDSRIRATAAVVLASSDSANDVMLAETTLLELCADTGEQGAAARRDVASAVRQIDDPRFRRLLIPLLSDPTRRSPTRRCAASRRQARPTSCSCRRWCRCCGTGS